MSLNEIAKRFVELCANGQNIDALNELYLEDAVSIEAAEMPGMDRIQRGRAALIAKNTWWVENHEVHASRLQGPFPHGDDSFACIWEIDVTNKPSGQRMQMQEVGVFAVKDGKICEEKFYYDCADAS